MFQEPNWDQIRRESSWAGSARSAEAENHKTFLERVDLQLRLFLGRNTKSPRREPAGGQEEGCGVYHQPSTVEYENSFGFVFQLSDGGLGVLYKDDTNFGVSADGKMVQFTDDEK